MLQEFRKKAGLTQAELAQKLKLNVQFISNMERELAPIPAKHFRSLNTLIGVPLSALYRYNIERYEERLKREVKRSK